MRLQGCAVTKCISVQFICQSEILCRNAFLGRLRAGQRGNISTYTLRLQNGPGRDNNLTL